MNSIITLFLLIAININTYAEDIVYCFDHRYADTGYALSMEVGESGDLFFQMIERSFVNPVHLSSLKFTSQRKINYSFVDSSSQSCALTFYGSRETDLGYQNVNLSFFSDGAINLSIKDLLPQYLLCAYKKEKEDNPDLFCTPGGSSDNALAAEVVMTTTDYTYVSTPANQEYVHMTCDKSEAYFKFLEMAQCQTNDKYISSLKI